MKLVDELQSRYSNLYRLGGEITMKLTALLAMAVQLLIRALYIYLLVQSWASNAARPDYELMKFATSHSENEIPEIP